MLTGAFQLHQVTFIPAINELVVGSDGSQDQPREAPSSQPFLAGEKVFNRARRLGSFERFLKRYIYLIVNRTTTETRRAILAVTLIHIVSERN
jgi:hypothetical protein